MTTPREIGLHLCIAKLLDRLCQVRLGVGDRCFGAGANLLCIVQCLPAWLRRYAISMRFRCSVALAFSSRACAFASSALADRTASSKRQWIDVSDSLSFGNRIAEIDGTCDEASQHAEREISLEARFYRTDKPRIAGCVRVRRWSRALAEQAPAACVSCLHPAVMSKRSRQRSDDRETGSS